MLEPSPNPPSICPLRNDDFDRLHARYPRLPLSANKGCITCSDTGTYRWWATPQRTEVADWKCDCTSQWLLNHYLLNANIGLAYQRLSWADMTWTEAGALGQVWDYMEHDAAYVRSGLGLILYGEMGCIQGGASISISRGGKCFSLPLADLVHRFGGGRPRGKSWDSSIPTYVQREAEDGMVRLGRLTGAWCSGVKTTYTVTTDTGRTVRATDEHPFLTEAGWKRLDELVVGEELHVRGGQATGRPRQAKTANVLYKIVTERVASVEEYGQEMTYDLEVADDPHNFLANGFVVHNTGKTALASLLLKHLLAQGHDGYFTTFSEMINTYTGGWNDKDERAWFHKRIKNAGVLVLDDIGREYQGRAKNGLPESTFDEVLRHRVASSVPTIITTNRDMTEMTEGYGGNVMSLLHERSVTYEFAGGDVRDHARMRLDAEVTQNLTRPVTLS